MPADGPMAGAPIAGTVSDSNVPQQPTAYPATDPNQVSTKPRQMPGGSGGDEQPGAEPGTPPGTDADESGTQGNPEGTSSPPPAPSAPPSNATAARVVAMMDTIQADNPGLPRRSAYLLARQALETYPIVVQAEVWNGLEWGHRHVSDGPLVNRLHKQPGESEPGSGDAEPAGAPGVGSPSAAGPPRPGSTPGRYEEPLHGTVMDPRALPSGRRGLPSGMDNGHVIPGQVVEPAAGGVDLAAMLPLLHGPVSPELQQGPGRHRVSQTV